MRAIFLWYLTALTVVSALKVSTTGRCGGSSGLTCAGSSFGSCCSQLSLATTYRLYERETNYKTPRYGWCGSSLDHCGEGCDIGHGTCRNAGSSTLRTSTRPSSTIRTTTRPSSAAASPTVKVSVNSRCGRTQGATGGFSCQGSIFGDCCSKYGYW
jgi:hypothetical protein